MKMNFSVTNKLAPISSLPIKALFLHSNEVYMVIEAEGNANKTKGILNLNTGTAYFTWDPDFKVVVIDKEDLIINFED